MAYNQAIQNQSKLQPVSMYMWRANRRENEKHAESVNREILRRQHTN
jgi:hypothetical protein